MSIKHGNIRARLRSWLPRAVAFLLAAVSCVGAESEPAPPVDATLFKCYSALAGFQMVLFVKTGDSPLDGSFEITHSAESIGGFQAGRPQRWRCVAHIPSNSSKIFRHPAASMDNTWGNIKVVFSPAADDQQEAKDSVNVAERLFWSFFIAAGESNRILSELYSSREPTFCRSFFGGVVDIPERCEELFFNRLVLGVKQLNQLSDKQFETLSRFVASGGVLTLLDNEDGEEIGGRSRRLASLDFGAKRSRLSQAAFEVATRQEAPPPEALPLCRDFKVNGDSRVSADPLMRRSYGQGLVCYIAFDPGDAGLAKRLTPHAVSVLLEHYSGAWLPSMHGGWPDARDKSDEGNAVVLWRNLGNPLIALVLGGSLLLSAGVMLVFWWSRRRGNSIIRRVASLWLLSVLFTTFFVLSAGVLMRRPPASSLLEMSVSSPDSNTMTTNGKLLLRGTTPGGVSVSWLRRPDNIFEESSRPLWGYQRFRQMKEQKRIVEMPAAFELKKIHYFDMSGSAGVEGDVKVSEDGAVSGRLVNRSERSLLGGLIFVRKYRNPKTWDKEIFGYVFSYKGIGENFMYVATPPMAPGDSCDLVKAPLADGLPPLDPASPLFKVLESMKCSTPQARSELFGAPLKAFAKGLDAPIHPIWVGVTAETGYTPLIDGTAPTSHAALIAQRLPGTIPPPPAGFEVEWRLDLESSDGKTLEQERKSGRTPARQGAAEQVFKTETYGATIRNLSVYALGPWLPFHERIDKATLHIGYNFDTKEIKSKTGAQAGALRLEVFNFETGAWDTLEEKSLSADIGSGPCAGGKGMIDVRLEPAKRYLRDGETAFYVKVTHRGDRLIEMKDAKFNAVYGGVGQ